MILDRVTITGADDSVTPEALAVLSDDYPFVEWGILFSQKHQGRSRYPSEDWIRRLMTTHILSPMKLSAHLCGGWVRDLVHNGTFTWADAYESHAFERVQLNFHGWAQIDDPTVALKQTGRQFIFQCDGVNDDFVRKMVVNGCGTPLFDVSGGGGVLPNTWPQAWPGVYCGYAGGLGPENVEAQVCGPILAAASSAHIWIDMETRVRSLNDTQFDLSKVRTVLNHIDVQVTHQSVAWKER